MGSVPRTLLLNHGPIELKNAGEIFLRTLAMHYPPGRLCRFAIMPPGTSWPARDWLGFPVMTAPGVDQRLRRRFGEPIGKVASFAVSEYARTMHARGLVDQAVAFARANGVEQVWAVVNIPQVIYVARRVAEELRVPLVITVWDPPERLADALGLDDWTRSRLSREFASTVLAARRVSVASEGMREEYRRRYGVDSLVLIQGLDPSWVRPPAQDFVDPERFIIGYAGSLYAFNELHALIHALSESGWRVCGRRVTLRVLGQSMELTSSVGVDIEWLGWRPMLEVIERLTEADVCYVPYWLDSAHDIAARLCFPNKIASYLAAGRPLFVHAPEDSSPAIFTRRYGVGRVCGSLESEQIMASLESLASDHVAYATMAQACTGAIVAELSLELFHRRFAQLLGADAADLTPVGEARVGDVI